MSYQFDARTLQAQSTLKPSRDFPKSRLLARREARQNRRAIRAL